MAEPVIKAYIEPKKCDSSPMCPARRACPEKAITQEKLGFLKLGLLKRGIPVVDQEKCVSCGECVKKCPHGAVVMVGPSAGQKRSKKKPKKKK
ncbi:MAG TPA: 4Fe-4S binding protein [Desulfosporosinus sp.]